MLTKVKSGGLWGIEGFPVEVEVDLSPGLPSFNVVGLPDNTVKEARDRVRSAIKNSGYSFPLKRITVNLSPSDLKKQGTHYDLPIAVGIVALEKGFVTGDWVLLGELSLDGSLKGVRGILPIVLSLLQEGFKKFIVPEENGAELAFLGEAEILCAGSLKDVVGFFEERKNLEKPKEKPHQEEKIQGDLREVRGQYLPKKALEVCAAGFHHLMFVGSPGSGKSMLANLVRTIAPPLDPKESLEVSRIYSVAGLLKDGLIRERPFQAPHCTTSEIALVGGGNPPSPGLISLAHRGYLLLDEALEFPKKALEALRQPLEEGRVTVSRAGRTVTFPAEFTLLMTMNPCPCGNYGNPKKECRCSPREVRNYASRLSEPIKERIDLKVWVSPPEEEELLSPDAGERSEEVRERVMRAYELQKERGTFNARLKGEALSRYCTALLSAGARKLTEKALKELKLSPRTYHKLLRVSRTVADLEGSERIEEEHVALALQLTL
ncbi:MAG: YifB family Mg chelatase-like AAA ATPase [Aquificae bacterium]|nr:YifB family Mg chelatase-like AAA ATPase [Aquificota bacterium]